MLLLMEMRQSARSLPLLLRSSSGAETGGSRSNLTGSAVLGRCGEVKGCLLGSRRGNPTGKRNTLSRCAILVGRRLSRPAWNFGDGGPGVIVT
jgi:hypothetical protein